MIYLFFLLYPPKSRLLIFYPNGKIFVILSLFVDRDSFALLLLQLKALNLGADNAVRKPQQIYKTNFG
jgi:hypothetical protein